MSFYLITGGAGFIGSNIVEALLQQGEKIRVLDNFSTGKRENLAPFLDHIDVLEGDIRSYHIVRKAVEGVDFVLHQAALPSIPRSIADPVTTNEVNVGGTLNVLDAAKDAGVKRLVFASSSSIYGDNEKLPKTEEMASQPLSPYAVSKLAGERYSQVFFSIFGLETVALRYFNVFGPRQDPASQYSAVIPKFIKIMKGGHSPVIFGDGEQSRDFTPVENVVYANLKACTAESSACAGEVFNIACGRRITVNQMIAFINRGLGSDIRPVYQPPRSGDVKHSLADIDKARRLIDYSIRVKFEDGLGKIIGDGE